MSWKIFDFRKDKEQIVLDAPTEEEANDAFNVIKANLKRYKGSKVQWQLSLPDPDTKEISGVGTVIRDL